MKTHSARLHLACIALLVPLLAALPACFLRERQPTKLLVIVVDSLRSDALSQSLGAAHTPNMRSLVTDGIAYRACYAHSSATLPAHVAILSSRLPHSSGVRNDVQPIEPDVPLLAEHLQERGWQTFAAVSTSELVPPALNQGIDRGYQTFRTPEIGFSDAATVAAQAVAFLSKADNAKPWFAYVDFSDPTSSADEAGDIDVSARVLLDGAPIGTVRTRDENPWSVEIDIAPGTHRLEMRSESTFSLRRFEASSARARYAPTFETGRMFAPVTRVVVTIVNDQDERVTCRFEAGIRAVQPLADTRAHYKQQVETVDRAIGQIVAQLVASGQYDHTLIVVTGSHGEALGEHGITGHDISLYDEVLRVPLVLKPVADEERRTELSRRQFELVRHIDVAPTLLDLLDERKLPGAEGLSFLDSGVRVLQAESHPPEAPSTIVARRDDRYKLVYIALEDRFEMYDVKGDTLEMDNLFELQGQFRPKWQDEMREIAMKAPNHASARVGTGPKVEVEADTKSPAAVKNCARRRARSIARRAPLAESDVGR